MVGSDHDMVYPMPTLVEFEPGRWRVFRVKHEPARSDLGFPMVISDEMPATEQVNGQFYTSKRAFRAVGRSLGLTEVGDDPARLRPKRRRVETRESKAARMASLQKAVAQYKSGRRPRA